MPKGLNIVSQFYGHLGIPNHARDFSEALAKKLNNVKLFQLAGADQGKDPNNKNIQHLFTKKLDPALPGLIFWYPESYLEYSIFDKNICYFVFEYNKIPKNRIDAINQMDAVCVPSKWAKKVLIENKVFIPVYVIPGGVSQKFNSLDRDKFKKNDGIYRFLHIGKAEERKGTEILIKAFNVAFQGDKKVRLTLSIDNPHIPGFTSEEYLAQLESSLKYPIGNIDLIHYEPYIKTLYDTHDCAVFPSKAEGIGLPIVEAMASSLPVITSNNSGISEYINFQNAIILNELEEVPVYDPHFFPKKGEYGIWMSPKVSELSQKMRWVYENQDQAREIGKVAEKWMHDNYSWDLAADKFIREVL